jgi:hypothetical protein
VTAAAEDVTEMSEPGRALTARDSGAKVTRPAVAALRREASGQPSQAGASVVSVTPAVEARCGSPHSAALSQPQIKTHAAKTHTTDRDSSTAAARVDWRRDANIEVSITNDRLFRPTRRHLPLPFNYFRAVDILSRTGCGRGRGTPVAKPAGHKGVKPMMSFRKHAVGSTRRPDSLLGGRARGAKAGALLALLLLAQTGAFAAPGQQQGAPPAPAAEPAVEAKIPIRVKRVETPDGPGVVATIGEFPED